MSLRTRCCYCQAGTLVSRIDFGPQPLCNRYLSGPAEAEAAFPLALAQCTACGLMQLQQPVIPDELRARVDWISYNEQEGHLDDLVEKVIRLTGGKCPATVGAISSKDDTTVARFQRKGTPSAWRLDPVADLGADDSRAALETVQALLNPERATVIAQARGPVDVLVVRHILEHAQDPHAFAAGLKRLVRPGGLLIFEVPDCAPGLSRCDYSMPWEEHVAYFTPDLFRTALARLGFRVLHFECYLYANENSLVAVVQDAGSEAVEVLDAAPGSAEALKLGNVYATAFPVYREQVRKALATEQQRGPVAVFGAGHLSCFWINALGVADNLAFVVDDHPRKKGMFMPGSRLPILGSAELLEKGVRLCLLSLSPESEQKVRNNQQAYVAAGGRFASIFPGRSSSLALHD